MDKYKVQQRLKEIFLDESIVFHENVFDEINELVVKTGLAKEFVRLWDKNIKLMKSLGMQVVETNNFEILLGTDGLYSMKFKGKNFNWRMIYSYDKETKKLMLHFFYERDDSNKDAYDKHIPIAQARRKEMENDYE